ncbi:MAG TPA: hypothetical protein VI685_17680 [Candidatus Angelobacter sp.]
MSKPEKRVLSRRGARIVDEKETAQINGGFVHTETACTLPDARAASLDGDAFTGECIYH